jgi:hypothetical protein
MVTSLSRGVSLAVVIAALSLLSASASFALPGAGSSEIQASAGFFHSQGSDDGNFNADLSYGYYLSPGWELGLRQGLNYLFRDDNPDAWTATTTPFLLYNFRITDVLVPYLGIHGGIVWNDRDVTGTMGPNAGLKLFFSPQTFINIGYRYEWFFDSFRSAANNRDNGNHVGNIGLGFVWGGSTTRTP